MSDYTSRATTTTIRATSRASVKVREPKKFVVYAHKSPNNKLYFGLMSLKPEHRWYSDGSGYRTQQLFYRAIKKYGWDKFDHIIIARDLSFSTECSLEKDLIAMFNSNNPAHGYNVSLVGDGNLGLHHTEKTKRKLSRINKRNKQYLNLLKNPHDNRKKCGLMNKKGKLVYSFNSISECATHLGLSVGCVSKNVKNGGTFGQLKFVEVK